MLHALGYAQELRRSMSGFSNFAISFTIISILSGTLTLYATGINYGGPVEEAYGWPPWSKPTSIGLPTPLYSGMLSAC